MENLPLPEIKELYEKAYNSKNETNAAERVFQKHLYRRHPGQIKLETIYGGTHPRIMVDIFTRATTKKISRVEQCKN